MSVHSHSLAVPPLVLSLLCLALLVPELSTSADATRRFEVLDYGARGDGKTVETEAINRAISACAVVGGGQVRFPPGTYLTGTIRLASKIVLYLEAGATIAGTTNLADYTQPSVPDFMPEARWGKWHRGLIVGENVRNVAITGPGTIDGRKVFDPTGEERMRGPHTIVLVNCSGFELRDVSIVDSANYALFFQVCDDVTIRGVRFFGGWDGVHFRGSPERWCRRASIVDCLFYTGDDAIAGRYWDDAVITGCVINSSCNGIRLIGPARHLIVSDCLFYGPGLQPHRTSARTNMLSGIILQPGAWDATRGILDDVLLADLTMRDVASPVTIWTKTNNPVGRITVSGLNATGVYRSAISAESWAPEPMTNVVIRNVAAEFAGGGSAEQAREEVRRPGVDARPLPAWGIYARNVEQLTLEDVRLSAARPDRRPVILAEDVATLRLDGVKFPEPPDGISALRTNRVGRLVNRP